MRVAICCRSPLWGWAIVSLLSAHVTLVNRIFSKKIVTVIACRDLFSRIRPLTAADSFILVVMDFAFVIECEVINTLFSIMTDHLVIFGHPFPSCANGYDAFMAISVVIQRDARFRGSTMFCCFVPLRTAGRTLW